MGDKLEKFTKENREGFDSEEPREDLWNRIEEELPAPQKESWWSYWKVAAMFFLVSTVMLLADKYQGTTEAPIQSMTISEEFSEAEQFYSRLIAERQVQIDVYEVQGDLHREFLDDMHELDDLYLELRTTFESKNGDQKLIDAMISNLRLRMRILDRQIEILERLNDYEYENKPSASA